MTEYLLVSFKTCPWVQRAAIVLREKNIAFEFRHIDRDNRPDWFLAISPHKKVPVLSIDGKVSLFESNAIAEYLDETTAPRLHPDDPVLRAVNRAWTDYVPTFADLVTGQAYADDEAAYTKSVKAIPVAFERLERALEQQGAGPFFNGARYSLVDAAYAPFLQRYLFLDGIRKLAEEGIVPGGSKSNLEYVHDKVQFAEVLSGSERLILADAQTNGGLLASLPSRESAAAMRALGRAGVSAVVVGEVLRGPAGIEVVK